MCIHNDLIDTGGQKDLTPFPVAVKCELFSKKFGLIKCEFDIYAYHIQRKIHYLNSLELEKNNMTSEIEQYTLDIEVASQGNVSIAG